MSAPIYEVISLVPFFSDVVETFFPRGICQFKSLSNVPAVAVYDTGSVISEWIISFGNYEYFGSDNH